MGTHSRKGHEISLVLGAVYDPERTGTMVFPPREEGSADHHHHKADDSPTVRIPRPPRHRAVVPPSNVRKTVQTATGVVMVVALAVVVGLVLNRDPSLQNVSAADAAAEPMASPSLSPSMGSSSTGQSTSDTVRELLTRSSQAQEQTVGVQLPVDTTSVTTTKPPAAPASTVQTSQAPVAPFCNTEPTCKAYSEVIVTPTQLGCFQEVVRRESSWNVYATNPTSGAYGLGQSLPPEKYASAGSDWRTNGATQLRWTLTYMNERYGSPCAALAFHDANNWY